MYSYDVISTRDEVDALNDDLNQVALKGGKVVSVMWIPQRPNPKDDSAPYRSKYVVVAEFQKG